MKTALAIFGIIAMTVLSIVLVISVTTGPKEFTLHTGTRCVSVNNAVTCDW